MQGWRRTFALLAACALTLSLCACEALLLPDDPPVTWVPLPTLGTTPAPSAAPPTFTPTPTEARSVPSPTPEPAPSPQDPTSVYNRIAERGVWARDQAWSHLVREYPDSLPIAQPEWLAVEERTADGETEFLYQDNSVSLVVAVPVPLQRSASSRVEVTGPKGFAWNGLVEPDGSVVADAPPTDQASRRVDGWRGTVRALPRGAQYDDYFRVLGDGSQYGIDSPDEGLRARLSELRNTGRVATVWGELLAGVPDYGQTQIVVERLDVEPLPRAAPTSSARDSELVEAWEGVIREAPAGARYDDFFDAHRPGGQYGITSLLPKIVAQLVAHRGTGQVVRVWGILDYGMLDHGGSAIVVSRLEVIGQ